MHRHMAWKTRGRWRCAMLRPGGHQYHPAHLEVEVYAGRVRRALHLLASLPMHRRSECNAPNCTASVDHRALHLLASCPCLEDQSASPPEASGGWPPPRGKQRQHEGPTRVPPPGWITQASVSTGCGPARGGAGSSRRQQWAGRSVCPACTAAVWHRRRTISRPMPPSHRARLASGTRGCPWPPWRSVPQVA